jgi:hypothetical protein
MTKILHTVSRNSLLKKKEDSELNGSNNSKDLGSDNLN